MGVVYNYYTSRLLFIFYYHTIENCLNHNVYLQVEIVIGNLFFVMQILY